MKLIIPASTQSELEKCLAIRYQAFVVEKNVPVDIERDDKDKVGSEAIHFLIYEDAEPVGTFRLTVNENMVASLQRFCIKAEYRGKGYGNYAMEFVEGFCYGQGIKKIVLHAQCTAAEFYKKLGFTEFSSVYKEAGIDHVKMMKKLSEEV